MSTKRRKPAPAAPATTVPAEYDGFTAALRGFIAARGEPVKFEDDPDVRGHQRVSTYGWSDHNAVDHVRPTDRYAGGGCHWEVTKGVLVTVESYLMFDSTYAGSSYENGVNVSGARCACGKYTDITLRWTGTLGELINYLAPKTAEEKGWTL